MYINLDRFEIDQVALFTLKQAIRAIIKTNRLFCNFFESMWSFALMQ